MRSAHPFVHISPEALSLPRTGSPNHTEFSTSPLYIWDTDTFQLCPQDQQSQQCSQKPPGAPRTWVQRGDVLAQPVILQHVQQGGFARVVQAQEDELARLLVQPCEEAETHTSSGAGTPGDANPNPWQNLLNK